jgi:hypothetical protein
VSALELFVVLVAWTWLRFYATRWRYELSEAYTWRRYYGRGSRLVTPLHAALRAFLP